MIARCTQKSHPHFHRYGGRGITVCKRWRDSFFDFYFDMGKRPSKKHSIDRIDNDGNYSCGNCAECREKGWPMNCRWATIHTQSRNRRQTHMITWNGKTQCLKDWADELGLGLSTLDARINVFGWHPDKAFTMPLSKKHSKAGKKRQAER